MDIARIRGAFPERRIEYYPSIASTMHAAAQLERGSVVVADEQTAGLGRHGHSWHSEPHAGIYCSLVLDVKPVLTLALGLATVEAISATTGFTCDIRWPNDVMLGGRKVAGILVQALDGKAVAGIGINVNHSAFPEDIARLATSLRLHAGRELEREAILAALIPAVDQFTALDQTSILRLFTQASSYAAGRRVTVDMPGGIIHGVTAGLDSAGFLIVRQDDGTETTVLAGGVRAAGS